MNLLKIIKKFLTEGSTTHHGIDQAVNVVRDQTLPKPR